MKSICSFTTKSDYEEYQNEVEMLAHVVEDGVENKVYLRDKQFSFCIHGYYHVDSKKNVRILGENVLMDNFAALKLTNLTTGEVKRESNIINKIVNLEAGDWKIDYGVYAREGGIYVMPASMLSGWVENQNNTRPLDDLTYVQVDPIVTQVSRLSIRVCPNLTGIMFGEMDDYPQTEVFGEPYSHNDVIINNHISFTGDSSINFIQGCPKIRNVYVADEVQGFNGCFGANDHWGSTYNHNNPVLSKVYLGKSVKVPSGGFMYFLNQNKITEYIVNPENNELEYDPVVQALVLKGTHIIVGGVGNYKNGMLKIPAGYTLRNYREYEGVGPIILDMSEYDQHTTLQGIRDLWSAELMILPKNLQRISLYRAGFPKAETIIIPTKVAPTCGWGDNNELGNRNNVYDYAFSTVTNMASLGTSVPVNKRKLYVIAGTAEEQATWTNPYDNQSSRYPEHPENPDHSNNVWYDGTTHEWCRPNLWHDLTLAWEDGDYRMRWSGEPGKPAKSSGPYHEYEIIFVPENEMDTLIQTKIQEKLVEIQSRGN